MTNSEITQAFINAWGTKNVDVIMGFFAEDAVYTNIPLEPPNRGKADIRAFIEGFIGMAEELEFVINNQAEGPNGVVMNERTDRFLIKGGWVELPVMGVFEFSDGKISNWRDYFDLGQFSSRLTGG